MTSLRLPQAELESAVGGSGRSGSKAATPKQPSSRHDASQKPSSSQGRSASRLRSSDRCGSAKRSMISASTGTSQTGTSSDAGVSFPTQDSLQSHRSRSLSTRRSEASLHSPADFGVPAGLHLEFNAGRTGEFGDPCGVAYRYLESYIRSPPKEISDRGMQMLQAQASTIFLGSPNSRSKRLPASSGLIGMPAGTPSLWDETSPVVTARSLSKRINAAGGSAATQRSQCHSNTKTPSTSQDEGRSALGSTASNISTVSRQSAGGTFKQSSSNTNVYQPTNSAHLSSNLEDKNRSARSLAMQAAAQTQQSATKSFAPAPRSKSARPPDSKSTRSSDRRSQSRKH